MGRDNMEPHEAVPVDMEDPVEPPPLPASGPPHRFATEQHTSAAKFLYEASVSGRLGSGPVEKDTDQQSHLALILRTIPWTILIVQFIWSGIVLGIAYALRPVNPDGSNKYTSLSVEFWTSKLNVSPSISYGVGWALFVLLGFFVREANGRYKEAQFAIERAMSSARQLYRQLRQIYSPGSWHPNDVERLAAHIIALPITLKMTLRGERERAQLDKILHEDDVTDIIETDLMYVQCSRVLRSYIYSTEDDASFSFPHSAIEKSSTCYGARCLNGFSIEGIDNACNNAVRIAHFHPSLGYMSHLRNFLYIWSFFLPLVLVQTSGWFTPLLSVTITYCVAMMFSIAQALNDPFGFDIQDIKLNRICADWAYQMMLEHSMCKYSMKENILTDHETPMWLEKELHGQGSAGPKKQPSLRQKIQAGFESVGRNLGSPFVCRYLSLFVAWITFIIFLTWGITRDNEVPRAPEDRWWSIYLPISTTTTGFISLGVFLLLGFWMNDAYSRYWNCMKLWNCKIKPGIEGMAFLFSYIPGKDFWHSRDHQRLISFFVAYAYSLKLHLRQSRDVSELEGVLDVRDLQALSQAPNLPNHCLNVIFAYLNSAESVEPDVVQGKDQNVGGTTYTMGFWMQGIEYAAAECEATKKYPISVSFTLHLFVFVTFWLTILPISIVKENGFLTFLFITPVAYAIINLLNIGLNLSDPFGFDREDIPMDRICEELKANIHSMFHETRDGLVGYIREEPYDRATFVPMFSSRPDSIDSEESGKEKNSALNRSTTPADDDEYTIRSCMQSVLDQLPKVSPVAQIAVTVWTIIAVFASWGFSNISNDWSSGLRGGCREWCSPIDVDGTTLANIGYALFMLLSFRASDAIGRYEDGAELVYNLKLQLHSNAVDYIHSFNQDYVHLKDRERFIAHLVQVPLLIRNKLLQGDSFNPISSDTLLSPDDQRRLAESKDPFEHLLRTLQSYIILFCREDRTPFTDQPLEFFSLISFNMTWRFQILRDTYAAMLSVKNFPVISRYSNHQYVFTALWLGMLPLYMTRQTGFFTILWAPIVSYGVFALQSIAEKLVDPFGEDSIDIPIRQLLTETAEEILATVEAHDWDCAKYTRPSPVETRPSLGARLIGGDVGAQRRLAHFEEHEATVENFGKSPIVKFKSSEITKVKPNLLAHFVQSVPWWGLLAIVAWAAVGCVISYVTRDRNVTDVRWWKPSISVATNVATYVSFAAFTLLGFFVQTAFKRYNQAGTVWGDNLRASCHAIAVGLFDLVQDGCVHEGDQRRIIAHIAAIPLVLKLELRKSRDLRELKGLLSFEDIARMQAAHSMTTHCVDVLRAYVNTMQMHKYRLAKDIKPSVNQFVIQNNQTVSLQTAIRSARFLNEFDIAPGFLVLLKSLLAIWFLLLPFVLAEVSGWFTILWVAIIAYGVLGTYSVATELQSPFGLDVNDLDLDKIADFIVKDILFVQKNYKAGLKVFTRPSPTVDLWKSKAVMKKKRPSFYVTNQQTKAEKVREGIRLAVDSVNSMQMVFNLGWAVACVLLAYGTSKWFKVDDAVCTSSWFCTYIAVDGSLGGFIGFALFLLLGFRLYDSHARYVMGVRLWKQDMLGIARSLATRMLCAFPPGAIHEGDVDRICGHISAFAICAMGALRHEDYEDKLGKVVSAEDVERILSARERIDYCMDVVRGYVLEAEGIAASGGPQPGGGFEIYMLLPIIDYLSQSAYECRRLVRIPLPFGYVQHLKIFLYIWLLLLPLSLVEKTGWLTILWVVIIAYGVFGVEHWSAELADPFGHDVSDVPLDDLCDEIIAEVKEVHAKIKGEGLGVWMHPDRSGLTGAIRSHHT